MGMEETRAIERVKHWLQTRKPGMPELDLDIDLIENRVIDSLMFFEFLFFLEGLTGHELEHNGTIHQFRTLRAIRDNILQPDS
jgi:hypothetical protein